jgi:hypothetical protein
MLGQSAERALNGELPNRDFDDYTGGLTLVHALSFREFGINSSSMRIVLFAFFVLWVPAVFFMASRFGSPYSAGAVTLLSVAWSVPNYPAPMPSWYNLYFATFGVVALFRYLEVRSRRWLCIAGLCGGLSILAKITGAYYIAGVFLFFIFVEQSSRGAEYRRPPPRSGFYSVTVTVTLAAFLGLLFSVVHKVPGVRGPIYFVLPAFALVLLLIAREFGGNPVHDRERFAALLALCVPFGIGVAIPLLGFLIPYMLSGAVHDLVRGLIAESATAIRSVAYAPENPVAMIEIIPFILPVIVAYECHKRGRLICGSILALFAGAVLVFSERSRLFYSFGWQSLSTSTPALVLAAVVIIWALRGQQKINLIRQQQIMLITCVTALCSVVQFPFARPLYFLYVAPLIIVLAMALLASGDHPPRFVLGTLTAFYLLFVVLRVTPGFTDYMGLQYMPDAQTYRLTLARAGGLRVKSSDAELYDELIPLIQLHASGKFIYAGPNCPEVYFLSGLQSPSRHNYDLAEEPLGHTARILTAIDSLNIKLVAVNLSPVYSDPMDARLKAALDERFPHSAEVGHFEVRWKQ